MIEALVAGALLASAIVGTGGVFALATRAGIDTRTLTTEVVLATQRLEELRGTPFDEQVRGETVESLGTFVRRTYTDSYSWDPENTVEIHVTVSKDGDAESPGTGVHLATLKTRTSP